MANWLDRLSPNVLRHVINLWPPFRCAGIKIVSFSPDYRQIKVILKQHWYNKNYVGTHFGGSMFSMVDPFFMLILLKNLGKDYIVWDKAASIEFMKPGRGTLTANFSMSEAEIATVRDRADTEKKFVFDKSIEILDAEGDVVASVKKTLFVRRKDSNRETKS